MYGIKSQEILLCVTRKIVLLEITLCILLSEQEMSASLPVMTLCSTAAKNEAPNYTARMCYMSTKAAMDSDTASMTSSTISGKYFISYDNYK